MIDGQDKIRLGGANRTSNAHIIADFAPTDDAGILADVKATPHGTSERAGLQLGDWFIGQDTKKNGVKDFGIVDSAGNVIMSLASAQPAPSLKETLYTAIATGTPVTLTAAQIAAANKSFINLTAVLAGAGVVNTPTAAQIVTQLGSAAAVNLSFQLRIANTSTGAFAWTVTGGAGITVLGNAVINQNTWVEYTVTLTSLSAATFQYVGTGTF
jgi:hypothetical protein